MTDTTTPLRIVVSVDLSEELCRRIEQLEPRVQLVRAWGDTASDRG